MRSKNKDLGKELIEGANSHLLEGNHHPQKGKNINPMTAKFYLASVIWEYNDQLPVSVAVLCPLVNSFFDEKVITKEALRTALVALLKDKLLVIVQDTDEQQYLRITYLGTLRLNASKRKIGQIYGALKQRKNEKEKIFGESVFELEEEDLISNIDLEEFELPAEAFENLNFD